jgi:hypothetical protein
VKSLLEKLEDAKRGEYVTENPVTVSRDCLDRIALTNYRRGQKHFRLELIDNVKHLIVKGPTGARETGWNQALSLVLDLLNLSEGSVQ